MGHETGRGGHWGSISCQVTEPTLGLSLPEWHNVSPVPSARLQAPAERELGMGFRALCLCNGKQGQRLVRVSRASGGAASCWRMCRVCTSHGSLEHVGCWGVSALCWHGVGRREDLGAWTPPLTGGCQFPVSEVGGACSCLESQRLELPFAS